jgi:DMSO/TMAO reductase YedYZ molybdopterin-dependent catalytic subunit
MTAMEQRRGQRDFLAGALAAVVMTLAMAALRAVTDVLSLPELLGEGIIRVMPAAMFSSILDAMQKAAKPTLAVLIVLGQLVVGGLLGRIYGAAPSWRRALAVTVATWLVVGLVICPLLKLAFFGAALSAGALTFAVTLLAVFLIYALALVQIRRLLILTESSTTVASEVLAPARRSLLTKLGLGFAALVIGGAGWRALTTPAGLGRSVASADNASGGPAAAPAPATPPGVPAPGEPAPAPFDAKGLSAEVTPTREFYTVSKNFIDPSVDVTGWSLTIDGLVDQPIHYDYETIQQLPSISSFYTLQCISNPVGGDQWGNAYWKGVRLQDLLAPAGLQPGIRKVIFHGADDYTDSVMLGQALTAGAILAYEMNGAPLEKVHGYPARLLIPGIYGMKNVKWITRVELVDYDFKGYWMERGWADAAPYKTSSRIDTPSPRATPGPGEVAIGGVAFAGDRGIRLVEYSLDGGQSWQPAELKPALAENAWQLWIARPTLATGHYSIKVRATDGQGALQTSREVDPLPDGASGYDTVTIAVA